MAAVTAYCGKACAPAPATKPSPELPTPHDIQHWQCGCGRDIPLEFGCTPSPVTLIISIFKPVCRILRHTISVVFLMASFLIIPFSFVLRTLSRAGGHSLAALDIFSVNILDWIGWGSLTVRSVRRMKLMRLLLHLLFNVFLGPIWTILEGVEQLAHSVLHSKSVLKARSPSNRTAEYEMAEVTSFMRQDVRDRTDFVTRAVEIESPHPAYVQITENEGSRKIFHYQSFESSPEDDEVDIYGDCEESPYKERDVSLEDQYHPNLDEPPRGLVLEPMPPQDTSEGRTLDQQIDHITECTPPEESMVQQTTFHSQQIPTKALQRLGITSAAEISTQHRYGTEVSAPHRHGTEPCTRCFTCDRRQAKHAQSRLPRRVKKSACHSRSHSSDSAESVKSSHSRSSQSPKKREHRVKWY